MIRLLLAIVAMVSLALTTVDARETHSGRSGSSKSRATKHSKSSRSKAATTKRKSASKKATTRRKASRLRDTGDIDVSTGAGQDLPPEDLPVSEGDEGNDSDEEPAVPPTP
ncbi:MAG: hypothetical protein ABR526_14105 [Chthoniobacterales bacterium]